MGDAMSGNSEQDSSGSHARTLSEENVALRVAWEMRRRGWSQERMAQELTNAGCPTHQSAISKIVNPKPDGSRRMISVDEAIAMARVFGIPLEELPLPPEAAEGRDLHELSRTVTREGRKAKARHAQFLLAWARLRYRLSQPDSRTLYQEFLTQRRVGADQASEAIKVWRHKPSWHDATAAYSKLERTLQTLGTGRDMAPPTDDVRRRHSVVADLLHARELFASRIPGTPVRVVPDLLDHFAQTLIRADLLEAAMPLIDSYARGTPHPVDEVVADIDRRLREIIARAPQDRHDHLESLAARIGLRGEVHETRDQQARSAGELGVSVEDYRDAKDLGDMYRESGMG
ncbi:helix-turn-helix protein [Nonomuraea fuscirosea]|uniref:Helix-turn-helix protein n=2 Tax=Nonomuraea fuscirosea TaxID=1291556 RepID=A0A2T0LXX5_9ACTN|nr:helix-turn-helix transcriptional regulator [Nonomuraea fuscirosea]PRX48968.1 helix-turn-helix protein [Nonomuraea fuscirosea]